MKPCTGCKHLNDQYYRGPICMIGHEPLPNDQYTGKEMIRIGFVDRVRSENGICGPDAKLYEVGFWRTLWSRIFGVAGNP